MPQRAFVKLYDNRVLEHSIGDVPEKVVAQEDQVEVPAENFDGLQYMFKLYDKATNTFISDSETSRLMELFLNPNPPAPPPPLFITVGEFRKLFSLPERAAIKTAAQTDSIISEFFSVAEALPGQIFDLKDDDTKFLLDHLVSQQIITAEKAASILNYKS
jgi:hypothetical protein